MLMDDHGRVLIRNTDLGCYQDCVCVCVRVRNIMETKVWGFNTKQKKPQLLNVERIE